MEDRIWSNDEGALVIGRSGIGKTTMIYMLTKALEKMFPDVFLYYTVNMKYDDVTKKEFYNRLIEDCHFQPGGKAGKRATGEMLAKYFWGKLIKEATKANKDIILFIDSGEKLTHDCYTMLSDIVDEVSCIETGITIKVFIFGTTEMHPVRNKFVSLNNDLVVRRFMKNPFEMKGIDNKDSLKTFLTQYDNRPARAGGSETFTELYFPEAYADGHRLAKDAAMIYDILRKNVRIDKDDVSMKSVVDPILNIFRTNGQFSKNSKYWPEKEDWIRAVEKADIIEKMGVSAELDRAWKKEMQDHDYA